MLPDVERQRILAKAKEFFREKIATGHLRNTEKCSQLREFNVNPFLLRYLAQFMDGDTSPRSLARALLLPRVAGPSITTTFGMHMQAFCTEVLGGFASGTAGLDIEFDDQVVGGRRYCQLKAGPNTINRDSAEHIMEQFGRITAVFRTNNSSVGLNSFVVGVFYGTPGELSHHYKRIARNHDVFVGAEFWKRLTGDDQFYHRLISVADQVAEETDTTGILDAVVAKLAAQIEARGI